MNHELIVFGVSALVAILLFVVLPLLMAKFGKGNLENYIKNSKFALGFIELFVKKLNLPGDKEKLVSQVIHYAKAAVDYVEELYKTGQLAKGERKAKAVEFVNKALAENGFEVTKKDETFIEHTIEIMVFMLPVTHQK